MDHEISKYKLFNFQDLNVIMDRLTGETEMLLGDGWRPMSKEGWESLSAKQPGWFKRYSLHITVLLGFLIWSLPGILRTSERASRFQHVGEDAFTMFDQKTAQACWSGPAVQDDFSKKFGLQPVPLDGTPANPPRVPFCKDLK
jgi:hypothetical protein